jgi:branched-chain amino acid transport system substrate-binding protein
MVVLNENQLFGIEQHDLWRPYADAQGWNIVHDEFVEWTQMEFSAIISKIKALKPDVIYVNFFFFRAIPLLKQFREQGVRANFIILPEAGTRMDWTDSKTGAGKIGNGILCFALFSKTYHGGGADDFRKSYQAKHGYRPGFLEATGYADIQTIAQAVELAGSTKTEDVRAALLKGKFETCYTPAKFDSAGLNELWKPVAGQWINDELENVYPPEAQTHKPVYPYAPAM